MLTLITGAPGAGKTAACVDLLRELSKTRAVYVDGIPELKIPHIVLEDAHDWHNVVPDGAIVVIDEVQRIWRPRGPGQKVPPDVAALETHRHRGIDFFLITQGPNLVDRNVRSLVGRHVHLRDIGVLGRYWYEWAEVSESLAWKSAPIRKRYRLPKAVFGEYKSASIHVKPLRSFPMALVVAGIAISGLVFFGYKSVVAVKERLTPAAAAGPASAAPGAAPGAKAPAQAAPPATPRPPRNALELRNAFTPVVPDRPETAPIYDSLRQVVRVPRVVGGFCNPQGCRCFNQDGGDPGISAGACMEHVKRPRFDPYYMPPERLGPAENNLVKTTSSQGR